MTFTFKNVVCCLKLVNRFSGVQKNSTVMNTLESLDSPVVNTLGSLDSPVGEYTRESRLPYDEYTGESTSRCIGNKHYNRFTIKLSW